MEHYVWWAVAGIGLIIVEMLSGTLILLVLGLAAFGGALAAWLGASFAVQAAVAVALAAVGILFYLINQILITGGWLIWLKIIILNCSNLIIIYF